MKNFIISLLIIASFSFKTKAQESVLLSLPDVIEIASKQSIDAFRNKNMYLSSYWEYRFYKAERRPGISLSTNPLDYNRFLKKEYNFETNEDEFRLREYLNSDIGINAFQNIGLTGGQLFVRSDLEMIKNLAGDKNTSFSATPFSIGYSQELNGYNELKWKSKIEPLKFEKAKKEFIQDIEDLRIKSTFRFF